MLMGMHFGFLLSLILMGLAVVGVFIFIPFVSDYAFWFALGMALVRLAYFERPWTWF